MNKQNLIRQSNIELLRIIAMFMILIRHANFYAIGMPSEWPDGGGYSDDLQLFIMSSFELFCAIGVNLFIIISGYFGIKCKLRSALRFIFQCLFYSIGIFLVAWLLGYAKPTMLSIAECFFMRRINWFPKAYLCLFILAPILNSYIEAASKSQLRNTLIAFFIFQTIYGCISDATSFLSFGYSTISFIGLYLLGRYIKLYPFKLTNLSAGINISIYVGISLLLSVAAFYLISSGHYAAFYRINAYCDPLIILSSLAFFIAFLKIKFESRIINSIAASCFAVYLVHSNPNIIFQFYTSTVKYIHLNSGTFELLFIFLFLCSVFITAILLDKIRIFVWHFIESQYDKKLSHRVKTPIVES